MRFGWVGMDCGDRAGQLVCRFYFRSDSGTQAGARSDGSCSQTFRTQARSSVAKSGTAVAQSVPWTKSDSTAVTNGGIHAHRSTDLYRIPEDRMGHFLAYNRKFYCPAVHDQYRTSSSFFPSCRDELILMDRIDAAHGRIRTLPFSRHAACCACFGRPQFSRVSSSVHSRPAEVCTDYHPRHGAGAVRIVERIFQNRREAGAVLARRLLSEYGDRSDIVVLAIPRGGVPVGFESLRRCMHPWMSWWCASWGARPRGIGNGRHRHGRGNGGQPGAGAGLVHP